MGGSSTKTVQQDYTPQQQQQIVDQERAQSEAEAKMIQQENEYNMLKYEKDKQAAEWEAGNAAREAITKDREEKIRLSGKLLTDFERQEKQRLLKAKTGVGQVKEEDYMLTEEQRQEALDFLSKDEDYWTVKRDSAYEEASRLAGERFGSLLEANEGKYKPKEVPGITNLNPDDISLFTNQQKLDNFKNDGTTIWKLMGGDQETAQEWVRLEQDAREDPTGGAYVG